MLLWKIEQFKCTAPPRIQLPPLFIMSVAGRKLTCTSCGRRHGPAQTSRSISLWDRCDVRTCLMCVVLQEPPWQILIQPGFVFSTRTESESGQCGRVQESHSDLMEPVLHWYTEEAASPRQMTASLQIPQKHPIFGRGTKPWGLYRNMTLVHLEQRRC